MELILTRSTANAVERPSLANLLRAVGLDENTFLFVGGDESLNIFTCYLGQLWGGKIWIYESTVVTYTSDLIIKACISVL